MVTLETIKRQVCGSEATFFDSNAIKRYIYQIRTKLGDSAENPQIILNERGMGYRFVRAGSPPAPNG